MTKPQTTLGKLAYQANKEAWPPASQYVPWEHLTDTARDGWSAIAEVIRTKVQDDVLGFCCRDMMKLGADEEIANSWKRSAAKMIEVQNEAGI